MNLNKSQNKNYKLGTIILKNLINENNTLSASIVGSFSETFNLKTSGDIDVVVVCKKNSKNYFLNCVKKMRDLNKKFPSLIKKKIIVNTNFGPIKFDSINNIVIHLMIYDLKSHLNHTIESPFTCYDWERSNFFLGLSLKQISPVLKLQPRDFYTSRRGIDDYVKDILNNNISYRIYNFKSVNSPKLIKKYFKIDTLNSLEFIYHIIKFLIINLIKLEINRNIKISKFKNY